MRLKTTVKIKGKLKLPTKKLMDKMVMAADEIGEVVMVVAKDEYLERRKTESSTPSMIIQSFDSTPATKRGTMVKKTIVVGGPTAPWASWVNDGHTLRNHTWWPGYEFMEHGIKAGKQVAPSIIKKHLNNR